MDFCRGKTIPGIKREPGWHRDIVKDPTRFSVGYAHAQASQLIKKTFLRCSLGSAGRENESVERSVISAIFGGTSQTQVTAYTYLFAFLIFQKTEAYKDSFPCRKKPKYSG